FFLLLSFAGINLMANCQVFAQTSTLDSLQNILESRDLHDTTKVRVLVQIGQTYIYSDVRKAEFYAKEALDIAQSTDVNKTKADAFKNMGNVNYYLSNYNLAVQYWLESLKYAEKMGNQLYMAALYGNIAAAHNELKEFRQGVFFLKKKLVMLQSTPQIQEEIFTYINLSSSYMGLDHYDSSFYFIDLGLEKSLESKNEFSEHHLYSLKCTGYTKLEEYEKALKYGLKVNTWSEASNNKDLLTLSSNQLSLIYAKLGDFEQAYRHNDKSLFLANEFGSKKWEMEAYDYRARIDREKGDFQQALTNYTNYISLRDSIIGEEKRVENARLEERYEAEKNYELIRNELEFQRQIKNIAIANSGFILLAAFGFIMVIQKKRKAQLAHKHEIFKAYVAETNLKFHRLQMNPHFIFNSLNAIRDYIKKERLNDADFYLGKFASLMRGTLENSQENYITLNEDLKALRAYLDLERGRLNNSFTYEIHLSAEINPDQVLIPPMILQPLIENAIWHGFGNDAENGKIRVQIEKQEANLICTILDNGKGFSESKQPKDGKSYGTRLIKERLDIISKLTHTKTGLDFINCQPGTQVNMVLPYILEEP
ncbi:MAG: histidine kinase, partial [Cyclobacteriaceae bacterium]